MAVGDWPSIALADTESDSLFENSIRPVLVEVCFGCHGGAKLSGSLRVDSREALLAGGDSGAAIVPGKPEESLLVQAIQRHDDVSAMPPDEDQALRPDQIAAFEAWIQTGAPWPKHTKKFESVSHWAFQPVVPAVAPFVETTARLQQPIDAFIRARQEAAGLQGAASADRRALLRRATFDLHGLPPTPEEIEAFQENASPDAWERVVERLLASPRYGERWGRHWLDVVRYADTAGETADYPVREACRYRNYVIDSLNSDKPYDEFLREQIAGDILAQACSGERYAELMTATGYLAISRRFGFDSENYQHLTIQDTIDTLGQSVLGLSLGCARCHDHKFDAISMRDYYALYGIFDSTRYAFPGSEQKQKFRSMVPLLPVEESLPKWRQFAHQISALAAKLEKLKQPVPAVVLRSLHDIDGDFEMQAPAAGGSNGVLVAPWLYRGPVSVTHAAQSPFQNLYPRGKVGASIAAAAGPYRITQTLYPQRSSNNFDTLHLNLDFRVGQANASSTARHRVWLGTQPDSPVIVVLISADAVSLQMDKSIEPIGKVEPNEWHNLQLSLNLSERSLSGKVSTAKATQEFREKRLPSDRAVAINQVAFEVLDGSHSHHLPAIDYDNLGVELSPLLPASIELPSTPETSNDSDYSDQLQKLLADGPVPLAYGVVEGTPHNAHIHLRGEPDQLGEEVPRGFIQILGGEVLPETTQGSGRLELAQWCTDARHPLTARVMANRIWQYHFGQGLVRTPNDFGVRGRRPTHPELLDHLAGELVRNEWSIKALHRKIMLSATYQQSFVAEHGHGKAIVGADTSDLYLRFPRRRLSAEEIRDAILYVSGVLDSVPGQTHSFPSPIGWGYTQHAPFNAVYDHSKRSVYLMTQRIKRHPFLALFDGPDPNATTPERLRTTVPTQALFFLNDPFVHAAADGWSSRLHANFSSEPERIDRAYREALGRPVSGEELQEAESFLAAYRAELAALGMPSDDRQPLSAFLRTILGSNEFLHVD